MTFIQALYGSQHKEIADKGRDGAKGRFNGNIFLAAFILLIFIVAFLAILRFVPGANDRANSGYHRLFGYMQGKSTGKLLAIPIMAIIYFAVSRTVGTEANFQKTVEEFYKQPLSEIDKANQKILIPFCVLCGLMLVLALSGL